jgi:putative transposase
VEEAAAMRRAVSPGTGRRYPLTMICTVLRVPRSTVYLAMAAAPVASVIRAKRGPKTAVSDGEIVTAIRAVLAATPFHGEGYRKIRARLARRGFAIGGKRVLRLLRQHQLLAPRRLGPPNGDPAHAGTIITARPEEMWGTDATRFYTEEDGWCWFFGAIDHCVDEVVGWHTAKIGDRWAALEPLRQGVRHVFGRFVKDVARGLRIRCDWGPQYIADAWINEVKWLGMTISHRTSGSLSVTVSSSASSARSRSNASISTAFRASPRRGGSSASSSRATTPSGSSSGSAIRRRWPRARRR